MSTQICLFSTKIIFTTFLSNQFQYQTATYVISIQYIHTDNLMWKAVCKAEYLTLVSNLTLSWHILPVSSKTLDEWRVQNAGSREAEESHRESAPHVWAAQGTPPGCEVQRWCCRLMCCCCVQTHMQKPQLPVCWYLRVGLWEVIKFQCGHEGGALLRRREKRDESLPLPLIPKDTVRKQLVG